MSIEDITDLALKVAKAHQEILNGNNHALDEIRSLLPNEREYTVITPLRCHHYQPLRCCELVWPYLFINEENFM